MADANRGVQSAMAPSNMVTSVATPGSVPTEADNPANGHSRSTARSGEGIQEESRTEDVRSDLVEGDEDNLYRRTAGAYAHVASTTNPTLRTPSNTLVRDTVQQHQWNRSKKQRKLNVEEDAFFDRFFQNMGAVGTLGSSITFALIVSQLQDPIEVSHRHHFDLSAVRILIASSWLLFTLQLMLSFFLAGWVRYTSLKLNSTKHGFKQRDRGSHSFVFAILYSLFVSAFMCLALVVAAYVDAVGFVAVAFVTVLALMVILYLTGVSQWFTEVFSMPLTKSLWGSVYDLYDSDAE